LIFDEITSGFREKTSGMHMIYNVEPDMCSFGKTISNGIPMAALIGKQKIMEYAQSTFVSSTYWTDRSGPSAALAFLKKHSELDVGSYLMRTGIRIKNGLRKAAECAGLKIIISGIPSLISFKLDVDNWPEVLTLYTQKMLDRGFLSSDRCYPNLAHTSEFVDSFLDAVFDVFSELSISIINNTVKKEIRGGVKIMGFKKV